MELSLLLYIVYGPAVLLAEGGRKEGRSSKIKEGKAEDEKTCPTEPKERSMTEKKTGKEEQDEEKMTDKDRTTKKRRRKEKRREREEEERGERK
ncbi:hypothetical protein E2C01_062506 [Portunus trituberculatus]|uniref:Uncharacterized protein n=1 Tax=Portunus trituberculatus TaxID=210409 RepID=A0A5B7HGA2_PORTR|nr:hypothetical protein [Portunus trituberculatus]